MKGNLKSSKLFLSFILVLILSSACAQKGNDPNDLRIGVHIENLKPLLSNNLQTITIDNIEETVIDINHNVDSTVMIDSTLIADLSDVDLNDDYIYFVDKKNHKLIRYNIKTKMIEQVGQAGRGPGDFNEPSEVRINGQYIFVYEEGNARVQIFDKKLEYVSEISVRTTFSGKVSFFDVNDNSLFISSPVSSSDEHVVQVYEFDRPFNRVFGFMPRSVAVGEENIAINIMNIRIDAEDRIYVSYNGLPHIFIFDKMLNKINALILRGDYVDDFYNFIPDRLNSQSLKNRDNVRSLIRSFDILDDKLFILIQGDLFVIDMKSNKVLARYRFKIGDELYFGGLVRVNESNLYLIDHSFHNRILKVKLNKNGLLLNNAKFFL